jgi:arabinofuranosyltransferase
MAKQQKKQAKTQKSTPKKIDISFSLDLNPLTNKIIISVLLLFSVLLPYYYITYAFSINNFNSFPLDDPWIHLTFAKNLAEYGSFSYFKNEIVTAGSTSPIYTFILAAGLLITKNEMWLSYITGILFFVLAVFYFYRTAGQTFPKENWLAIAAALIFVCDKWINLISVTGMETTLYIFLLLACFYYYRKRNAVLFAVMLGLTFWARPDALAFIGAISVDYLFLLYVKNRSPKENEDVMLFSKSDLVKIGAVSGGIVAVYFIMNLLISGSLLPNTYGAKVGYYSPEFRSRTDFLKFEVFEYFTESAYLLIFIPFIFGVIKLLSDSVRFKYNHNLAAVIFIFALIFIYWYKLPYAHRFGRYLMPVLPFYILLAVYGGRVFFKWLAEYISEKNIVNALNVILLIVTILYFASEYNKNMMTYSDQSRHIYIRQVEAAKWLKENTPEGSVIATHDVGAIAYYSDRKVVDVVGLINPEFIPKLNTKEFTGFVQEQLKKQNVSYVAFLREWFQVVNQPPLLTAGDQNFEIMQIYSYIPDKTHILSMEVNSGMEYVGGLLGKGQFQQAISVLNQLVTMDPNSSVTYYLLAYCYTKLGNAALAEKNLLMALQLYPDYSEATIALANLYKAQNRIPEAKSIIEKYLSYNSQDSTINTFYNSLKEFDVPKNDTILTK